ncbi:uncharacterized protein [Lolium perenne]|uniref:uncharacterized protein n=1 Tax=Lolium perenne TaxID=4522 RepID=UPI003A9A50C7
MPHVTYFDPKEADSTLSRFVIGYRMELTKKYIIPCLVLVYFIYKNKCIYDSGTIMAMGWLTRPNIIVYGGTLKHGNFEGNSYDIVSASRATEIC